MKKYFLFIFLISASICFANSDSLIDSLLFDVGMKKPSEQLKTYKQVIALCSNDPEKALDYSEVALGIARKENNYSEVANLLHNIGFYHYQMSSYTKSISYFEDALKIKKDLDDNDSYANTLNSIGLVYLDWSDYENALYYFQESLKIYEKTGNKQKQSISLNNIGLVYYDWENYEQTLKYYNQSLQIREMLDDRSGISSTLNNMGNVYYSMGNYEAALECFKESLKIKEELDNKRGIANTLNNIGRIYADLKKFEVAMRYYSQSLEIKKEINNRKGIASTLTNLGELYSLMGDYPKSLENYQASLLLTDSMNLISEKLEVLSGLSETYRKMGKYNESLDFYQEYIVLRDSVYNNRSRIMISELQSRYETDKKEKEIELLTVENDIKTLSLQKSRNQFNLVLIILILSCILVGIFLLLYRLKTRTNKILEQKNHELTSMNDLLQLSEDRLKEINEAKNRLFGIVSHDLRNSFNVLLGFSEILAQKARTLDDAKRLQYNEAIYKSSRQMYELLDNLLKWTNKQTGAIRNNPEVTDLRIVITEISELLQINAREKGINIIIGIPQNLYILFDRNLLSTIVRNLLANAVKFSHPGNNVHINCSEKEGFIEISITDTGIGIPAAKMDKLFRIDERFTSEGTNQEKGTGLGLILCREFTEMMDGSIKVESTEGKGSTFTVCIPLKQYNL